MSTCIARVAVPSPLHRSFDYLWPGAPGELAPGMRVRVPFGRREVVAVVIEVGHDSELSLDKLKPIRSRLDDSPAIPAELMSLAAWATRYYHYPLGEVLNLTLPTLLRRGEAATPQQELSWAVTASGQAADSTQLEQRAPRQAALLHHLQAFPGGLTAASLKAVNPHWRAPLKALLEQGWVGEQQAPAYGTVSGSGEGRAPELNTAQAEACAQIAEHGEGFGVFLLEGVTGSGKTEVYLDAIERTLAQGRQVLVLVPEIGLTPQLVERFAARYTAPLTVLHSGLSERERLSGWLAGRDGAAGIIIGTRSAVFTPLARPGLIVIDEEHDGSFKQQDGLRYSARDLALVRAKGLNTPVILGSATPSLESLHNVERGLYTHLRLPKRAGEAKPPSFKVLDIRSRPLSGGLSEPLLEEVGRHLRADGQVLLFLNRRGYAPTVLCHECGWQAVCDRCDARLTLHQRAKRMRCHHCGHERAIPRHCASCRSPDLRPVGQGTERVEATLCERFPDVELLRIDRDSTRRKGAMEDLLEQARQGRARLLLGTQMLAKGHHLPEVTLVAIIDADQGLFGADFRAPERLAQLIIQVAGRAGREARRGEVIIQTHHPEHPLLQTLLGEGYARFAQEDLAQRRLAELPPYSAMALLRAEALTAAQPQAFLAAARSKAQELGHEGVFLMGPVPAPMERRAGRYRSQLLLQAGRRSDLHRLLDAWVPALATLPTARRVRWSLDVDPLETL